MEMNTEADSNDNSEWAYHDHPYAAMSGMSDAVFMCIQRRLYHSNLGANAPRKVLEEGLSHFCGCDFK